MGAFPKSAAMAMAIALAGVAHDGGAATRYWTLEGVAFSDGAVATGSFGYDDVAAKLTDWNIRVQGGTGHLPFTYVPANALAEAYPGAYLSIVFYAQGVVNAAGSRELSITVLDTLDGVPATVPIVPSIGAGDVSHERSPFRKIVAGSLVQVPFPPPIGVVDVVEYYHAGFDHYFITGDAHEVQVLDTGTIAGWTRTGQVFQAYAIGSSPGPVTHPVCRYFGVPVPAISSHFYSASAPECYQVLAQFGAVWQVESDNVFQVDRPDSGGACPAGTLPVYRLFNNQADANHRYTTSASVRSQMEAAGWVREGYGPEGVVFCAIGP